MTDLINNPNHYAQAGTTIEPIDILRYCPFDLGNCIKYILRAPYKGTTEQDYLKADRYLTWVIESIFANSEEPYTTWFATYGLLLKKFDAFKGISLDFVDFIEYIDNILHDNLEHVPGRYARREITRIKDICA